MLKPHESYSDCGHGICRESDYYDIDQATLKRICEANTIDVKITGRNYSEVFHVNSFIIYAQQFYNAVYDSNAYQESLKMGYVGSFGDNGCIVTLCIALIMGVI